MPGYGRWLFCWPLWFRWWRKWRFRGYLLRRLAASDFSSNEAGRLPGSPSWCIRSHSGLLHGRWVAGTLASMAFALAVYLRGKLGDAVVANMTANALIALYVVVADAWSLR